MEKEKHNVIDQVIVVDNFSTDNSYEAALQLPCKTIRTKGTVAAVRNSGAALAKTTFLAFIDADVIISPGWSLAALETINNYQKQEILTGSICIAPNNGNWIERTWFGALQRRNNHNYINSGNLIIHRTLFNHIRGFDESLTSGEDVDLCQRAQKAGGRVIHEARVEAVHLGYPKTLSHFFKREVWHGSTMLQDIASPWKNKALMLALAHLNFIILLLLSAVFHPTTSKALLLCYPLFPLSLAFIRMKKQLSTKVIPLAFLISVYGFARAYSLCKSIKDKNIAN